MTEAKTLWGNLGVGLVFFILGINFLIIIYTRYGPPEPSDASMFIPWLLIIAGVFNIFGFILSIKREVKKT